MTVGGGRASGVYGPLPCPFAGPCIGLLPGPWAPGGEPSPVQGSVASHHRTFTQVWWKRQAEAMR